MKNRPLLGMAALLILSISGLTAKAQQVDVCKTHTTGPGLYFDTSAGSAGVDIKQGSLSVPAQVMQTADRAHIGLSELIAAAGKSGVKIFATNNVYFGGDLQLSPMKWQTVKISAPQAIAIFGALVLSHHLTLEVEGQQIEQCGGGNGRSIVNVNLCLTNRSGDHPEYNKAFRQLWRIYENYW
jgi:hypothetical protein